MFDIININNIHYRSMGRLLESIAENVNKAHEDFCSPNSDCNDARIDSIGDLENALQDTYRLQERIKEKIQLHKKMLAL